MMNTTGMMQGQQLVRIQGQVTGQQVTLQPGQPVTIQGQQMRMQGKNSFINTLKLDCTCIIFKSSVT